VVVAWKDHGRRDLDPLIAHALRAACWHAVATARYRLAGDRMIALVPVPSSTQASRRRGGRVLEQTLASVAAQLPAPTVLHPAVTMGRGARDQVGLGAKARRANVRERLRLAVAPPPQALIILVDDVVTTGASLAETARVLPSENPVVGAAVIAVTPPPGA
jgi:predicted amidophosphoribosyltransferase